MSSLTRATARALFLLRAHALSPFRLCVLARPLRLFFLLASRCPTFCCSFCYSCVSTHAQTHTHTNKHKHTHIRKHARVLLFWGSEFLWRCVFGSARKEAHNFVMSARTCISMLYILMHTYKKVAPCVQMFGRLGHYVKIKVVLLVCARVRICICSLFLSLSLVRTLFLSHSHFVCVFSLT